MTAYYNENDPRAAAWLRELVRRDLIAAGEVDERSISDVRPEDLDGYTQHHFFAGIGGWSYALRLADWPDDRPCWTGSCPCQPFSAAGKGKGTGDERHLWPAFRWLIAQRRPATVFGEQVASRAGREWITGVRADLEVMGYAVGAADLCAAGIGAPHIRQRLWWVADAECQRAGVGNQGEQGQAGQRGRGLANDGDDGGVGKPQQQGLEGHAGHVTDGDQPGRQQQDQAGSVAEAGSSSGLGHPATGRTVDWWGGAVHIPCGDGKARRIGPGVAPLADGVPARVVRLRGFGNAIVPQLAATFIRSFPGAVS